MCGGGWRVAKPTLQPISLPPVVNSLQEGERGVECAEGEVVVGDGLTSPGAPGCSRASVAAGSVSRPAAQSHCFVALGKLLDLSEPR